MFELIYCTLDTPSEQIKKLYRTIHEHNIQHEVIQNPKNNSVYKIQATATKKTVSVLRELGFKWIEDKENHNG